MTKTIEEIKAYISELNSKYKEGITTEHSFRGALETLLKNLTDLTVVNEAKHIDCGAPDLTLLQKNIPIGYVEAKDIGKNLNSKDYKNQFDRYKKALDNLIITDYVTFQLFEDEYLVTEIAIGKILPDKIEPLPDSFNAFAEMIKNFSLYNGKAIKDSQKLAEYMAAKTKLLAEVIEKTIAVKDDDNSLRQQLKGFQQVLLPTMTDMQFADIYAQTIAYGMFVARLQDSSNENFTRQYAATLIPLSNPFLRNLFQYIAGFDLDENIKWIVDSLADMFNYVDVADIHKEFESKDKDPFLHFYEDFLTKYDKNLKNTRGAYYTPLAVVKFIVNAIDDILKTDFDIPTGLADTSMVEQFHKIQILDPATGTGTFLAEVVRKIYKRFENNAGMWNDYVKNHLIPRLNGFEIMMSPYTMAHLKLEMILQETGYIPQQSNSATSRLHIYLTDALEDPKQNIQRIPFAQWLSNEAIEAAKVKNSAPVMVVLGNPPYSVSSQNKGKWIQELIVDYKKDLNERKTNLDDDYIKFIRYGQFFIDKNGEGVLAYISNNSFIDGVTHRQMRKSLLTTFDKIYILDLHGSSIKKETTPDGGKDENVFDIMQGVSINIFVKTKLKLKTELAEVYHFDLYGKRKEKYSFLLTNNLQSIQWQKIDNKNPFFFFVPKLEKYKEEYESGFEIDKLFPINNSGVKTDRDSLFIDDDRKALVNRIEILLSREFDSSFQKKYDVRNSSSYKLTEAIKGKQFDDSFINQVEYRPFDIKWIYYSPALISRPASKVMKHFVKHDNLGLIIGRQGQVVGSMPWNLVFFTKQIVDTNLYYRGGGMVFPLYLYPETDKLFSEDNRKPNLNETIINEIAQRLRLHFTDEKTTTKNTFAPIDVLDYIYAVLHSPTYREKYKEFLKIDFPRILYPKDDKQFWRLVKLGGKLRRLHLLEGVEPQQGMADYPIAGSNEVEKPQFIDGKVYINETQYFDNVPSVAWNFYIGGYQPAQKWLKDRKGKTLGYDDIRHYQKIIWVLKETEEVMREVDEVIGIK